MAFIQMKNLPTAGWKKKQLHIVKYCIHSFIFVFTAFLWKVVKTDSTGTCQTFCVVNQCFSEFEINIIIIIIISIFWEDNEFSMNASLPFGPPINTDIDYYQAFSLFTVASDFFLCIYVLIH